MKEVKGVDFNTIIPYTDIKQPEDLICDEIKYGKFETDSLIIERSTFYQVQTDKISGEVNEYDIKWVGPCEYELFPLTEKGHNMKVKVTEVSEDYYDCYTTSEIYGKKIRINKM
ncbi:hypothetical protein [Flammeovirga aprica]|uniref:Uncharacterized protein n=1 Tax=Flammeovirga aprica JL-4 TaxID=694437 RepID=A0A7X9S290_9BACT|nr:hypothetical protein [Flammeovirga aprica]NME72984.1 hypothetical protein [Flammeovirga aprica JL-4]